MEKLKTWLNFILLGFLLISVSGIRLEKRYTQSEEEFDKKSFKNFDMNGDNRIDKNEYEHYWFGGNPEVLDMTFDRADQDRDGEITFNEWRAWDGTT